MNPQQYLFYLARLGKTVREGTINTMMPKGDIYEANLKADATFAKDDRNGLKRRADSLIKALEEAGGPRAHRVGCDCGAADCVRIRAAVLSYKTYTKEMD